MALHACRQRGRWAAQTWLDGPSQKRHNTLGAPVWHSSAGTTRERQSSISMTGNAVLKRLLSAAPLIAPSMLKCDFANLHREVELLESAGARMLHLDVMDGHFVPNLSYGPMVIERLRAITDLPFEAHLMISEPARYLDEYLNAGCNLVTFHIEAVPEPAGLLRKIHEHGSAAGISLNPGTSVDRVLPYVKDCEAILVMSVEPGFGGQKFMPAVLDK